MHYIRFKSSFLYHYWRKRDEYKKFIDYWAYAHQLFLHFGDVELINYSHQLRAELLSRERKKKCRKLLKMLNNKN